MHTSEQYVIGTYTFVDTFALQWKEDWDNWIVTVYHIIFTDVSFLPLFVGKHRTLHVQQQAAKIKCRTGNSVSQNVWNIRQGNNIKKSSYVLVLSHIVFGCQMCFKFCVWRTIKYTLPCQCLHLTKRNDGLRVHFKTFYWCDHCICSG